ncbi:hypothetical protein GCM10010104_17930 [Streptomyces indiaensis]|uniref:Uncharacterized protein n=1 Tax=Streptomyces indiaensis TaxID=284033 RepID=A0ABN3DAW3_9ACTN
MHSPQSRESGAAADAPPGPENPNTAQAAATSAAYFVILFMPSSLTDPPEHPHPGNCLVFQGVYPRAAPRGPHRTPRAES